MARDDPTVDHPEDGADVRGQDRPDDQVEDRPDVRAEESTIDRTVIRISPGSAAAAVGIIVVAIVAQRIFVAAHRPLSWAAAALVAAILLDPIVDVLGRRIPRGLAVLAALVVVIGIGVGVAYLAFDELGRAVDRLERAAEEAAQELEARDDRIGRLARDVNATRRVDVFIDDVERRTSRGSDVLAATGETAPAYVVGTVLTVFLMSYGPRMASAALSQVPQPGRRERVTQVVSPAIERGRRAVLLSTLFAVGVGVAVGLAARLFDLPAPAALGLIAGVLTLLPHVGIVLGSVPLLLVVLAFHSNTAAIVATAIVFAAQAVDSLVVRPRIARKSVHVGLFVPWAVALIGYAVYGVGGAAYGTIIAVFGLALIDELEHARNA